LFDIERPSEAHIAYVRPFIGNLEIVPVCLSESAAAPNLSGDCVSLSLLCAELDILVNRVNYGSFVGTAGHLCSGQFQLSARMTF